MARNYTHTWTAYNLHQALHCKERLAPVNIPSEHYSMQCVREMCSTLCVPPLKSPPSQRLPSSPSSPLLLDSCLSQSAAMCRVINPDLISRCNCVLVYLCTYVCVCICALVCVCICAECSILAWSGQLPSSGVRPPPAALELLCIKLQPPPPASVCHTLGHTPPREGNPCQGFPQCAKMAA